MFLLNAFSHMVLTVFIHSFLSMRQLESGERLTGFPLQKEGLF